VSFFKWSPDQRANRSAPRSTIRIDADAQGAALGLRRGSLPRFGCRFGAFILNTSARSGASKCRRIPKG